MIVSSQIHQFAERLFEAFLGFQRRSRATNRKLNLSLSILEGHALYEILENVATNSQSLAAALSIDPSSAHRLLERLVEGALVSVQPSPSHARYRVFTVTKHGEREFERWEHGVGEAAEDLVFVLSPSERDKLRDFLARLADGFGVPSVRRLTFHPVGAQLFRLSRGFKLFSRSYFDTGLTLSACQLLAVLFCAAEPISAAKLLLVVPLEQSTISRAVAKLTSMRFVASTRARDARTKILTLSEKGRERYAKMVEVGGESMAKAIVGWNGAEVDHCIELLNRCAAPPPSVIAPVSYTITKLKSSAQCAKLRGLYLRHLVNHRLENQVSELPFRPENLCFQIQDREVIGGIELQLKAGTFVVKACFWAREGDFPTAAILAALPRQYRGQPIVFV